MSFSLPAFSQVEGEARLVPVRERSSCLQNTDLLQYENPAVNWNRYTSSLSVVSGMYKTSRKGLSFMETGNGWDGGSFHAESYTKLGRQSAVWGNAVYRNGRRKSVKWNETLDYERVYPYVTADSIGGSMQEETHYFQGCFAEKRGKWSYGVQMTYRSESAFRTSDPRPKNDLGLIGGKIGGTLDVNPRSAVGLYGFAEKYNLTQSVQFMNPRGKKTLYHITGMGTDYVRFAGDYGASVYKGRTLGAGVMWTSLQSEGPGLALCIEQFHLQKQLVLTNTYVPLNDIDQLCYKGEAFYRWKRAWIKGGGTYSSRVGTEHIYDDGTQNYHEIAVSEPFRNRQYSLYVVGAHEWQMASSSMFGVQPSLSLTSLEATYAYPFKRLVSRSLNARLKLNFMCSAKRILWEIGGDVHVKVPLHSDLYLKDMGDFLQKNGISSEKYDVLQKKYEVLSTGGTGLGVYACWHYALDDVLRSVYLRPVYTCTFFRNGRQNHVFSLSLGITI